jgi:type I restriction enzyme, S subunit
MDVMIENKVVPKLRFDGFNEEWEKKKLGEFCSFTQGIQLPQSEQVKNYKEGYIRYLYIRDFFNTSFKCYVKDEYPNKIIEPHQIMMVNTGNTSGKAFRGQRGVLSNNCFKVTWNESSFDADYMFLYLTSNFLQNQIKRFFNRGGQPHLGHKNVAILPFSFPSISEQQKIASFLTAVDEKLQQLKKKKDLLGEYKKGVMQKIFSQELRFKDDNGNNYPNWEEKELREVILDFIVPMRDKPKVLIGDIPWCRIEDFSGKYLSKSKSNQGVTEEIIKEMNLKVYPVNTVLVSCSANLGFCAIVKKPLITNQTFIGLVPSKFVDSDFLLYSMRLSARRLNVLASGTTISYLSRNKFENFKLKFPSLMEQQKIANFLSSLDSKIDLVSTQIEKTKSFKKGLLQQMFV